MQVLPFNLKIKSDDCQSGPGSTLNSLITIAYGRALTLLPFKLFTSTVPSVRHQLPISFSK